MSFVIGEILVTFSVKVNGETINSTIEIIISAVTLYFLVKKEIREQKQTAQK